MVKKSNIIIIIVLLILIYFITWLFIDLPPKITPNIDYIKKMKLTKFSKEEVTKMETTYKNSNFIQKICFYKYLQARDREILKYCINNNLGKNIGGGCYHGVGTYNQEDTYNMINYCQIKF